MPRPIKAIIHLDALRRNFKKIRQQRPDENFFAVVKANAYGHGLHNAMKGLHAADGLAVMELMDAQHLRELGWRKPILLIEGVFEPRDLEICSRLDLIHAIHCQDQLEWLAQHKTTIPHNVYLKLNAGMNRLGFKPDFYREAWARLNHLPQAQSIGLMMHFSSADTQNGVQEQYKTFHQTTKDLPGERSLCNSAACLAHPEISNDWNRVGIAMYGASFDYPSQTCNALELEPVMTLQSALIDIQTLHAGDTVGYGDKYRASSDMRIGIVACGYADGYPRIAPSGSPVLIDGIPTQTVGMISMEMLAIDLTHIPQAHLGSIATLWGKAPNGCTLSVDEVALRAQTIGYELLTALSPRVPTEVIDTE